MRELLQARSSTKERFPPQQNQAMAKRGSGVLASPSYNKPPTTPQPQLYGATRIIVLHDSTITGMSPLPKHLPPTHPPHSTTLKKHTIIPRTNPLAADCKAKTATQKHTTTSTPLACTWPKRAPRRHPLRSAQGLLAYDTTRQTLKRKHLHKFNKQTDILCTQEATLPAPPLQLGHHHRVSYRSGRTTPGTRLAYLRSFKKVPSKPSTRLCTNINDIHPGRVLTVHLSLPPDTRLPHDFQRAPAGGFRTHKDHMIF
jgi:hypothetical protein